MQCIDLVVKLKNRNDSSWNPNPYILLLYLKKVYDFATIFFLDVNDRSQTFYLPFCLYFFQQQLLTYSNNLSNNKNFVIM